jgi:hypothetical protein
VPEKKGWPLPEEWSSARKWWMDLLKSVLSFTIIAALTYAIVDDFQYQRDRRRARLVERGLAKSAAIEQFRNASLRYREAALDAFVDLSALHKQPASTDKRKSEAMLNYAGVAYDDYLVALERIRADFSRCSGLGKLLDELEVSNKARHKIYDKLFDLKDDGFVKFDGDPSSKRPDFDAGVEQFTKKREQVLTKLRHCPPHGDA